MKNLLAALTAAVVCLGLFQAPGFARMTIHEAGGGSKCRQNGFSGLGSACLKGDVTYRIGGHVSDPTGRHRPVVPHQRA